DCRPRRCSPNDISRYKRRLCDAFFFPQTLITAEEMSSVFANGTSQCKSKLSAAKFGLFAVYEVARVEAVITVKTEYGAMERIAARFGDYIEYTAASYPAMFRAHTVNVSSKLLNGLDACHCSASPGRGIVQGIVSIGAVHYKKIFRGAGSAH